MQYLNAQQQAQSSLDSIADAYHSWEKESNQERALDLASITAIQKAQADYALAKELEATLETTPEIIAYTAQKNLLSKRSHFGALYSLVGEGFAIAGFLPYFSSRLRRKRDQRDAQETTPTPA